MKKFLVLLSVLTAMILGASFPAHAFNGIVATVGGPGLLSNHYICNGQSWTFAVNVTRTQGQSPPYPYDDWIDYYNPYFKAGVPAPTFSNEFLLTMSCSVERMIDRNTYMSGIGVDYYYIPFPIPQTICRAYAHVPNGQWQYSGTLTMAANAWQYVGTVEPGVPYGTSKLESAVFRDDIAHGGTGLGLRCLGGIPLGPILLR